MRLHPGYAVATIGYVVSTVATVGGPPAGGGWPALLAVVVEVPLFAGLAACILLCLTDGKWQRNLSWRLYAAVVAVSGGFAALGEWYAVASGRAGSLAGLALSACGIVGLVVAHRLAHRQDII